MFSRLLLSVPGLSGLVFVSDDSWLGVNWNKGEEGGGVVCCWDLLRLLARSPSQTGLTRFGRR